MYQPSSSRASSGALLAASSCSTIAQRVSPRGHYRRRHSLEPHTTIMAYFGSASVAPMPYIDPSSDTFAQLITDAETKRGPIRMINLLKFKDVADYGDLPDPSTTGSPSTGAEAYARYGAIAMGEFAPVGATIFFAAAADMTVIGADDEQWDQVAIIEYPSREKFIAMVSKPSYQAGVFHRTAGLADTRLIMTSGF